LLSGAPPPPPPHDLICLKGCLLSRCRRRVKGRARCRDTLASKPPVVFGGRWRAREARP